MQLLISNEQQEAAIDEELCSLIENALREVLSGEAGSPCSQAIGDREVEVSLALVDDARMAALNEQYRGIAGTTDVLSSPMVSDVGRLTPDVGQKTEAKSKTKNENLARNTSDMELLLGDIVISVPKALSQAAAYGNTFHQEMVFLAVHGMLHLLGYDDETDHDDARMMELAQQVTDKLGLGAVGDE